MRIVVDGRSLRHHDDELRDAAHHLLGALSALRDDDEIHLLVSGDPEMCLPDRVVTHHLGSNGLTRAATAWRRNRALRPDVILGFTPTAEAEPHSRLRRGRVGSHRADATVSMSARLRPELAAQASGVQSRPLRVLAAPGSALLTLSGSNRVMPGRGGVPRLMVVDDAVAEQLGREQATWVDVATRLRAALLDTLAMNSWQDRRFKVRPTTVPSITAIPLPLAPAAANRSRARLHRSARWIGGVSAATLTLSAVAAASVNMVLPVHSPPHAATTPSVVSPAVTSQVTTPAVTPTTLAPSTTNTTSSVARSVTTTTSGVAPTTTPTTAVTSQAPSLVGPTLTLPSITLPSIQLPSLPLPQLSCSSSTTTTTTSALQLINPCALPLTGTVLGGL